MFTLVKEAELKLTEVANNIAHEAISWRAVYFNFHKLLEHYKSDYQIQIAVNLLGDLLTDYQGGIYVCADQTIIMLCRNISKNKIDKAIFQLRYLFMDDPLAYDSTGEENSNFCTVFDLGKEYAEFYQLCHKKLAQSSQTSKGESRKAKAGKDKQEEKSGDFFTPKKLAWIEQDLNKADLSLMLRRQSICVVNSHNNVRRVFDEYYIHISHLRQMLHTKMDFFSNIWLFKYLTRILDDRMLDLISQNPLRYMDGPVSLNFNVETLLSKKFIQFDALVKSLVKFTIVIEIQIGEVFADIRAFTAARNILQKLGYKICLDGLTSLSIVQIEREKLGCDFVKLQWNADMEEDVSATDNQYLLNVIKQFGSNRVILARCDNAQAVNYGQAMGINLFQGRYIDSLINPNMKVRN